MCLVAHLSGRLLLDGGSPVNHANLLGDTALILAARSGRSQLVQLLVQRGADPTQPNHEGRTPMHFACENGHKEIVLSADQTIAQCTSATVRGRRRSG